MICFAFSCVLKLSIHPCTQWHLLWSIPWYNFLSTFDGQILCSASPLVSVRPPATLFITVSSLPQALGVLWALPSYNDQMWLGPWSLCQQRTGGQPQPVGIPHAGDGYETEIKLGKKNAALTRVPVRASACGRCWECIAKITLGKRLLQPSGRQEVGCIHSQEADVGKW